MFRRGRIFTILTTVIALGAVSLASRPSAGSEGQGDRKPVLVRNAGLILTMDPQLGTGPLGIIEGGDVLFDRSGILAVGKDLQAQDAEVLDATNRIVMPGFVDLHDHLFQTGIRGCGSDKDVNGWLAQCVRPLDRLNLSEEEIYALVRLSTLGVLSTGITTTVDWSSATTPQFARRNIRALADSGLRFVFAYRGTRSSIGRLLRADGLAVRLLRQDRLAAMSSLPVSRRGCDSSRRHPTSSLDRSLRGQTVSSLIQRRECHVI